MGLLIFTLVANLYLLLSQWSLLTVIQVTFFCWYLHFDNFNILKTACARAVSSIQYGHYSIMEEFSTWMMNFVFPWWWFQIRKRLLYRHIPYSTFNITILMWTVLDLKKKILTQFFFISILILSGLLIWCKLEIWNYHIFLQPNQVGSCGVPLKSILKSDTLHLDCSLDVQENSISRPTSASRRGSDVEGSYGKLKVSYPPKQEMGMSSTQESILIK